MTRRAYIPGRRLASSPRRRRPLISLTPLIDVVFILLVFFLLASSFLDWRAIDLSAPAEEAAGASMQGALLVEVREGGLWLSGEAVSLEDLESRLAAHVAEAPGRRVLVRPAGGVSLQRAVEVLDRAAKAGVIEMSLVRGAGG